MAITKQEREDAILFKVCRDGAISDEHALLDFELIQNKLAYQKVHVLQPQKTARGYKTKQYRTMVEQFEKMIEAHIPEYNAL